MPSTLFKSAMGEMNSQDWKKWVKNTLIFLGPALVVLLASFQGQVPQDWRYAGIALWAINTMLDLLRKYLKDNTK